MGNLYIYKSSAGSGKTYTLAKEYIKLALKTPLYFRHILAITFTNKATEEMQNRIITFLKELSLGTNPELLNQLELELNRNDIKQAAEKTLKAILHNYSDFSVSTIDSFFNKILRNFAKELDLNSGFTLELDLKNTLPKITENLWKLSQKDPSLYEYLKDLIFIKMSKDGGWNVDNDINKLSGEIFRERFYRKQYFAAAKKEYDKEIITNFVLKANAIITGFYENLKNISDNSEKFIAKYNLTVNDFKGGSKGAIQWLTNLNKKTEHVWVSAKRAIENEEERYSKTSKLKNEISKCYEDGLLQILSDAVNFYEENIKKVITADIVLKTIYYTGIFSDLIKLVAEYREENNLLFQQDVNLVLRKVIEKDNIPFIFEKTGLKYFHFLIDEFQDTSDLQWENLHPLIENSISEGRTSIIVGDEKQAIYRWRDGNPELLTEKIETDLHLFKDEIINSSLNYNFRSSDLIVEFNNRLFDGNFDNFVWQKTSKPKPGGFIEINFHQKSSDDNKIFVSNNSNIFTLKKIKEALSCNFSLKDILILVRNGYEGVETAKYLSENNIAVISSESLLIYTNPKVSLLINIMKYLSNKNNLIAKKSILNDSSVYFNMNITENQLSEKMLNNLSGLTVFELTEVLMRRFNLDKCFDAFLAKFLDVSFKFSSDGNSDIKSFLDWWDEKAESFSISMPENRNAVRILTIHKAKGLQSPVVIIPYLSWKMNIDSGNFYMWASADIEPFNEYPEYYVQPVKKIANSYFRDDVDAENIKTVRDNKNLLYVAFTRTEQILFANAILPPERKTDSKNNDDNSSSGDNTVSKFVLTRILSEEKLKSYYKDNVFSFGVIPKKNTNEYNYKDDDTVIPVYISSEWYRKTVIKTSYHNIKLWETNFDKKSFGENIHFLLSAIQNISMKNDIINSALMNGFLNKEKMNTLKSVIDSFFEIEQVKYWFKEDWNIFTEREILLPGGDLLRPDRVIEKEGRCIVIDYKTGEYNKKHEEQISLYADVLNSMGYSDIKKYLMFIPAEKNGKFEIKEVI